MLFWPSTGRNFVDYRWQRGSNRLHKLDSSKRLAHMSIMRTIVWTNDK